jgi:hypothetical protein
MNNRHQYPLLKSKVKRIMELGLGVIEVGDNRIQNVKEDGEFKLYIFNFNE